MLDWLRNLMGPSKRFLEEQKRRRLDLAAAEVKEHDRILGARLNIQNRKMHEQELVIQLQQQHINALERELGQ